MSEPGSVEIEAENLVSFSSFEALKPKHDFVVLGLPGAPASGKGMWAGASELQRRLGNESFIYEESVSAPKAFAGERAKTERYGRIADRVVEKLGGRKELVVIGHSMGGAEALLFLDKISADERFKGIKVDLVVFSPINYGTEGWKGVWGWAEGTKRVLDKRDVFEAHIACPLPYEVAKKISPLMTENEGFEELIIKDELRDRRRSLFEGAIRGKKDAFEAYTVIQNINIIDAELTRQVLRGQEPDSHLLEKRSKLIAPYIPALFDAEQLSPESKRLLKDIYEPDKNLLLSYLNPSFFKALSPYAREMFNMSYEGFAKVLRNINTRLKQKSVSLNTSLVYMRNDKFETQEQAKKAMQEVKVDEIASVWALSDSTHFTVFYQPQMMMDVVEQVTGKKMSS